MDARYARIGTKIQQLRGIIQQALMYDLIEIQMTMAASAGLLFPMPGMAAAAQAVPMVLAAHGKSQQALSQVASIYHGWLGKSRASSQLLAEGSQQWEALSSEASDIREAMRAVQQRGQSSQWKGEAFEAWMRFTEEHISRHDQFVAAVQTVPPTMEGARQVTDGLMGIVQAQTEAVCEHAQGIAILPPSPNPMGLGIATRSITVAASVEQLAAFYMLTKAGFPWVPPTTALTAQLQTTGSTIEASGHGRRRNGNGQGQAPGHAKRP